MKMADIKEMLNTWARPLLAKYLLRGLTYGATALSAKLAIDSPNVDWLTKIAEWVAAAGCAGAAMLIDYYQHRADKKDVVQARLK